MGRLVYRSAAIRLRRFRHPFRAARRRAFGVSVRIVFSAPLYPVVIYRDDLIFEQQPL